MVALDTQGKGIGSQLRRYSAANKTGTSYSISTGLQAGPLDDNWIPLAGHIGIGPIIPFGADASGESFKMRILGAWAVQNGEAIDYYVAVIAELEVTLGDTTGGAGRAITDSERFAYKIDVTSGPIATGYADAVPTVNSGTDAAGDIAHAWIKDAGQPDAFAFDFDLDAGAGADSAGANALIGAFT